MRKILFLPIAFTIAVSASADVGNWRDYRPTKKQATTQSFQDRFKLYAEAHKAKTVASQLRDGAPEVIYDQPEANWWSTLKRVTHSFTIQMDCNKLQALREPP